MFPSSEKPNYGGGTLGGGTPGDGTLGGAPGIGPPVATPVRTSSGGGGKSNLSKAAEAEAKRKAVQQETQRVIEFAREKVKSGVAKINKAPNKVKALEMLEKLIGNIVSNPKEEKFQKIRLTNEKIAAVVIETDGAREILEAAGFSVQGEFMVFSDANDKSYHGVREVLNSVRTAVYDVKGRPPATEGELGGQARFGTWAGEGKIGQDEALASQVASSGGICAEKFEAKMEMDGDNFTIEQARALEDALEHMQENNPSEAYLATINMIFNILDGIVADPDNTARRCIPRNAEFEAKTSACEGSLRVLEASGFTLMAVDAEEMDYICDLGPRALRGIKDRVEGAKIAGKQLGALDRMKASTNVPETVARNTKVIRIVGSKNAADIAIPEHFFELTKGDAAAGMSQTAANPKMKTEHMRQKEALARRRKYKRTMIRVQLPDGLLIQMEFSPRERVSDLFGSVTEALADQGREYTLSLGSGVLDSPNHSLWDAQLVPSALLHFRWFNPSSSDDLSAILKDELLCSVEFIE